MSVQKFSLPLV